MSRLEEALRRSQSSLSPVPPSSRQGEVFASPWSVNSEGAAAAAAVGAPPPRAEEKPSGAPRILTSTSRSMLDGSWKAWFSSPGVDPSVVEQFRKLAAALFHAQRERRLKVVMVTSAVPGEGKTMTALNIARVLSESYR